VVPVLAKRGGVRHFLEIGNVLVDRGYDYTIFTDDPAEKLDWFEFRGKIADWRYGIGADILLVGDPQLLPAIDKMSGKIYVWVLATGPYREMYEPYRHKFPFLLINRWFLREYPEGIVVELGVNTKHFFPKKRTVLYWDGGLHKQAHIVKRALEGIKSVSLVELKDLDNDQLAKRYRTADYLVSWEMEGGFSNTAAEALASGITVVTNGNNVDPFIDKCVVLKNEIELRRFFEDPMGDHTWEKTVDNLLNIIDPKKDVTS
jgi:hypothetical protein